MAKKQVIKLTESDLHKIIKESVKSILSERNVGEIGMSDEEVSNRRTANFIKDYDDPYHEDSIYDDINQNYFDGMNTMRRNIHLSQQEDSRRLKKDPNYDPWNDGDKWIGTTKIKESNLHNIIEKSVNKILKENSAYNPKTGKREKQYEFNRDEINQLVSFLQENPIIDMYKPINLGYCKVQRIPANEVGGRQGMLNDRVLISYGSTDGSVYLQIDRKPNTHWMEESGYTYMAWKY